MEHRLNRRSFALLAGTAAVLARNAFAQSTGSSTETGSKLPAADLPSMNPQGHRFELSSTFSGNFNNVPTDAPVFRMELIAYAADDVKELAERLGINGDINDLGGDTFSAESRQGKLYVMQGRVQYTSTEDSGDGDLPDDEKSIGLAREWLRTNGLLPGDADDGRIMLRSEEPRRVVVGFQPVRPSPLISSTPLVTVSIGPNGRVLEAANAWAKITQDMIYQLRGADNAWQEVVDRRAWVDASLPTDKFAPGMTVGGSVEYTQLSLAYTTSGIPGEDQFLQPVYVFHGQLTPDGTTDHFQVQAYVAALINSNQPVG